MWQVYQPEGAYVHEDGSDPPSALVCLQGLLLSLTHPSTLVETPSRGVERGQVAQSVFYPVFVGSGNGYQSQFNRKKVNQPPLHTFYFHSHLI